MNPSLARSALPIFVLALLFVTSAHVAQTHEAYFVEIVSGRGAFGLALYVLLAALATVVAPLTTIPLMPIAVAVWGVFVTALASIAGWMLGAAVAFYLSRTYGRGLIERLVSAERLKLLEEQVPKKDLFWTIVFLRMAIPVDVLSYVLGLSKQISWKIYLSATLVGVTPFAFVLAYAGTLPLRYQLPLALASAGIVVVLLRRRRAKPEVTGRASDY